MTTIDTSTGAGFAPLVLGPNQPNPRPYRGGAGIARFRGAVQQSPYSPEDFVASTTEIFAGGGVGLTTLPDGRSLKDAVIADPIGFLGEDHVRRYGARTMLLVKLLDTAERLFVHYHPDNEFAARRLGSPLGKTEAWVVIDVLEPGTGYAALGFNRDVSTAEINRWFQGQDADDMLGAMNHVDLAPGDSLFVPAGLAHAIGPGLTLVELQQPTDLSVLLEYNGFDGLTRNDALLGLGLDAAMEGLDRRAVDPATLSLLTSRRGTDSDQTLFPGIADEFFSAQRIRISGSQHFEAGFSVLVVLEGTGTLEYGSGELVISRGMTVLTAHAAGDFEIHGELEVLRCQPPR